MKLAAALRHGGDKGNSKATSPVAEKVGEAGGAIVLVRTQLRVGKHVHGDKEEAISKPLENPGESVVIVVGRQCKGAVVPHGRTDCGEAKRQEHTRGDKLPLDQLRGHWSKESNHQRSGAENQAGVDGAIAI